MHATYADLQSEKKYKKTLASYFAKKNAYWKTIYNPQHQQGNLFMNAHIRTRKETVLDLLDKCSTSAALSILDIGCGTGALMKDILQRGDQVIGIDICEKMLAEAQKTVRECFPARTLLSQADVENLPFKDHSFDIVTCIGVIEYLYNEETGLREIKRIIKDNGFLIIELPNIIKLNKMLDPHFYVDRGIKFLIHKIKSLRNGSAKMVKQEDDFSTNDSFSNRRYFRHEIKNLFKRHGFREIDSVSLGFGPPILWKKQLFSFAAAVTITKIMERLSQKKIFSFMNYLPNRWVLCEQKLIK